MKTAKKTPRTATKLSSVSGYLLGLRADDAQQAQQLTTKIIIFSFVGLLVNSDAS